VEFGQLVHRDAQPRPADPPAAPWVPAALCFGPAAGTLGVGFAAGLEGRALLVAPISSLLFGAFLAVRRMLERARLRGELLNRRALRPQHGRLVALADRLADSERPVSASGIVAVNRLLTLPDSPLYAHPGPDGPVRDTGAELGAILDRLEVRR
jgi:hypothetical protein